MPIDAKPAFPAHRACETVASSTPKIFTNLESVVGKRFLHLGLPLRLVGGTGCPIRAVALLDT